MKVVGREKLTRFMKKHAAAKSPISSWLAEVSSAQWNGPQDIKNRFASVSFLADNRVVFNIGGNKFRLAVVVYFSGGVVLIDRVGTHAEYNHWKF
jgi:mRNA interferase HigB